MKKQYGTSVWMFSEPFIYHHSRPLFKPATYQFFRYGSYRMKVFLLEDKKTAFEFAGVAAPIIFLFLPLISRFYQPAGAVLLFYFLYITIEGLFFKKSILDHLLRLFAIPYVHIYYAAGLVYRLARFSKDTHTYVRLETLAPEKPGK